MSTIGLAASPLPPGNVLFDTVAFPATFANTAPINVTWNRRLRTKPTISLQGDADETPDITTTYYVRHGPPHSFRTEVSLGTGTSGTFNFGFAGLNLVEVYAKAGGFTSSILSFLTAVTVGDGDVSAGGPIGTITLSAPGIDALVGAGGPVGTVGVMPSIIPHVSGVLGTLTITEVDGSVSILTGGPIPVVAVLPILGAIHAGVNASGSIPSITSTPPEGMDEIFAAASGSIGTVTIDDVTGTIVLPIPTVVQSAYSDGHTVDPTITMGSSPTVGNWIIACYFPNGAVTNPNTTYWTEIARDGTPPKAVLYYHKVQIGDGATLGVFESPAATSEQAAVAWEIAGANATWVNALDFTQFDYQGSGASSLTTTSIDTNHANELALIAFAEFL